MFGNRSVGCPFNTVSATWTHQLQSWGWAGDKLWLILDSNAIQYWLMFLAALGSLYSGYNYFSNNWEMICKELEQEKE